MCKGMLKLPLCPYCHAVYHYRQVRENTHKEEIACHNCGKKFKVSYKKGRALLLLAAAAVLVAVNLICLNLFENITVWVCLGVTAFLLALTIPMFPYTVRYKTGEKISAIRFV